MDIGIFENRLKDVIGHPSDLRPFVCDGSPLNCSVFIVGFNATTSLDFWAFWRHGDGYDKASWEAAYRQQRLAKGKRQLSNTRAMIDWILDALPHDVKVLETNIYAKPSPRAADLVEHERNTSVFRFLLSSIQPRVIVACGDEAQQEIGRLLGHDFEGTLLTTKHLRFWSRDRALELADQIKRALA